MWPTATSVTSAGPLCTENCVARIPVRFEKEMEVRTDFDTAYAVVSDYERSARLFPGVESFHKEPGQGSHVYRWRSERFEVKGFDMNLEYVARYRSDKKKREVSWQSLPGSGTVEVDGRWLLSSAGDRTFMKLSLEVYLDLPLGSLVLRMATPFVEKILERPGDKYMERVRKAVEQDAQKKRKKT